MTARAHVERTIGVGDQPHRATVIAANGRTLSGLTEHYHNAEDAEHALVLTLEALMYDLDADVVGDIVATWMTRVEAQAGTPPG